MELLENSSRFASSENPVCVIVYFFSHSFTRGRDLQGLPFHPSSTVQPLSFRGNTETGPSLSCLSLPGDRAWRHCCYFALYSITWDRGNGERGQVVYSITWDRGNGERGQVVYSITWDRGNGQRGQVVYRETEKRLTLYPISLKIVGFLFCLFGVRGLGRKSEHNNLITHFLKTVVFYFCF